MRIIFIGTSEFATIILEKLFQFDYRPVLVITAPDKPVGRKQIITPPPVKLVAKKYKIPVIQPKEIRNLELDYNPPTASSHLRWAPIRNLNPDLIIVCAYGEILPKAILDIPKYGCLNLHPSLLPRWRGPSPIQYTILSGDRETGVTIILMDEKIDQGKIISNLKYQISNIKITSKELATELANFGAKLLIETIPKWIKGEIKPLPQDESKATYTKILKKEDGRIDWRKTAQEIERRIRAFQPWPGIFTLFKGRILKILEADIVQLQTEKQMGEVFLTKNKKLVVQCGQNCLILRKLQLEGKKPVTAEEFLRGRSNFVGEILK